MGSLCEATPTIYLIFLQLSIRLTDSARACPIQLCSAYFTVLVKELLDWMLTGGFNIPLLMIMDKKSKELTTFQEVINYASTKYKSLKEEEDI